uniref:Evasin n=1 Tax=Rhipicephalus zambeziensis TaxID=60191 RepID=A0A224YCR9_9ACAR
MMRFGHSFVSSTLWVVAMRLLWYLILLVGVVTSEDDNISRTSPSTPTTLKATTSTLSTTQETTTPMTTTKRGPREEDRQKYGYYTERGCLYKVLLSHNKLYPADCMYGCNWYPRIHTFYDGFRCLMVLERRFQERQYGSSTVCRTGRCLRGVCVPDGYVQKCMIPNNGIRIPQRPLYHRYE